MRLPVNHAISILSRSITIFDTVKALVRGEDEQTQEADRIVQGTITSPSGRDLQMLEAGEIANGSIIVHIFSNDMIYMSDVNSTEVTTRQTFVRYDDSIWRIKQRMPRVHHGQYRRYIAVKYVDRSFDRVS